jgi:branched-chain amino acid transport system permease protein
MLLFVWNVMHGRIGRALIAIRDNEIAASAMGVNVALYKTTVFGIASAFAGFAGAVNAAVIQFASPDQYSPLVSIRVFVGAVIGGVASVPGAVFGGLFTQFIPDIAAGVSKAAADAVQAVILIVFMYAMRGGFAGFVVQTWHYGRRGVQLLRPPAARRQGQEAAAPASAASPSGSE